MNFRCGGILTGVAVQCAGSAGGGGTSAFRDRMDLAYETARDNGHRLERIELLLQCRSRRSGPGSRSIPNFFSAFRTMVGFGGALTESSAWVLAQLRSSRPGQVPRGGGGVLHRYFDPVAGIGYTLARTHINSCDFSLGTSGARRDPRPGCGVEGLLPRSHATLGAPADPRGARRRRGRHAASDGFTLESAGLDEDERPDGRGRGRCCPEIPCSVQSWARYYFRALCRGDAPRGEDPHLGVDGAERTGRRCRSGIPASILNAGGAARLCATHLGRWRWPGLPTWVLGGHNRDGIERRADARCDP